MRLIFLAFLALVVADQPGMDEVMSAIGELSGNPQAGEAFYQRMKEIMDAPSCGEPDSNLCKLRDGLAQSTWYHQMEEAHKKRTSK